MPQQKLQPNRVTTAQVGAKKELSNGMGAVEYPNPIGF